MPITKKEQGNTTTYSFDGQVLITSTLTDAPDVTLKIDGTIKTNAAPCFDEAVKNTMSLYKSFTLDLSGVTYIASAGLRVLLNMQQTLDEDDNADVKIVNVPENVKEVFEQTGFVNILNIID